MRRILAFILISALAACSQMPSAPSTPGGSTGTLATVVDVPISVDVTEGMTGTWNWAGQSVRIPAGSDVSDVRFAWYDYNPRGATTAFGRVYVLDREFLGIPGDLSPSTPGFLARSDAEASGSPSAQGSEYTLPASLVLKANTRYWFYTDKQGAFAFSFNKDQYADGNLYVTGYPTNPFRALTTDANFRLRGVAR